MLRLHVIANSDSPEDQAVKLKVRDAVLREASRWYEDARTMEEANSAVCTHLESITAAAREVLLENGVRQTAAAEAVSYTHLDVYKRQENHLPFLFASSIRAEAPNKIRLRAANRIRFAASAQK